MGRSESVDSGLLTAAISNALFGASPPLVYFSSGKREQNKPAPSSDEEGSCV